MIRCAECNEEQMDGLEYCDSCGAKLEAGAIVLGKVQTTEEAPAELRPVRRPRQKKLRQKKLWLKRLKLRTRRVSRRLGGVRRWPEMCLRRLRQKKPCPKSLLSAMTRQRSAALRSPSPGGAPWGKSLNSRPETILGGSVGPGFRFFS